MRVLLPATWRRPTRAQSAGTNFGSGSDGSVFDQEEGEGMVGFDVSADGRDALARREEAPESVRRLSRDLEEGFRDDSDDGRGQQEEEAQEAQNQAQAPRRGRTPAWITSRMQNISESTG